MLSNLLSKIKWGAVWAIDRENYKKARAIETALAKAALRNSYAKQSKILLGWHTTEILIPTEVTRLKNSCSLPAKFTRDERFQILSSKLGGFDIVKSQVGHSHYGESRTPMQLWDAPKKLGRPKKSAALVPACATQLGKIHDGRKLEDILNRAHVTEDKLAGALRKAFDYIRDEKKVKVIEELPVQEPFFKRNFRLPTFWGLLPEMTLAGA